jgi:hypothetical protein
MLNLPMATVVQHLPLAESVSSALVDPDGSSPVAGPLNAVLLHEKGDWETLIARGYDPGLLTQLTAEVLGPDMEPLKMSA